uniref:Tetraspanin 17 n=1 Tax=Pipistrellus kuhlii TaxID=59472 RepID=A0A7J7XCY0_PIPKU|nr:tetraspanin 17 [Pipistrellus kuhlii]
MPGKHQHFQEPGVGCCGKYFLFGFNIVFWFSVFLGLIFFLELATGILVFVFKDWIRDQLNLFINNNVKAYRDDIDLQNLIDFAQEYEDVLNTQCGYDVRLKLELEQQGSIHTKGCVGQFEKWLQDNLVIVAGVFVGIALLQVQGAPTPLPSPPPPPDGLSLTHFPSEQIFGICLAQNLVSDIQAVKANW